MEILNNATVDELREFMSKDEMADLMRKLLQDLETSTVVLTLYSSTAGMFKLPIVSP